MSNFGIGQPIRRKEDPRLLTGKGQYVADLNFPNQAYSTFLRSSHAHARIVKINTENAKTYIFDKIDLNLITN